MEELRRGGSAVHEFNHIVILGWNRKVISILRFFEALRQKQPVVILANTDIGKVSEEVRLVERRGGDEVSSASFTMYLPRLFEAPRACLAHDGAVQQQRRRRRHF